MDIQASQVTLGRSIIHGNPISQTSVAETSSKVSSKLSGILTGSDHLIYNLAIGATAGGFLMGYNLGIMNGANQILKEDLQQSDHFLDMTALSSTFFAVVFTLVAGYLTDAIGRKPCIMAAALVFSVSAIVTGTAGGPTTLLLGRTIAGTGIGVVSTVVPIYVAECAPTELRGKLLVLFQLNITLGICVAAFLTDFLGHLTNGWRIMFGMGVVPGLFQFVFFMGFPESPRYLVMKDDIKEATTTLQDIRDTKDVSNELEAIVRSMKNKRDKKGWNLIKYTATTRYIRKALIIGCLIHILQQFSGIQVVIHYSSFVFRTSGLDLRWAIRLSLLPLTVNFLMTFPTFWAVDKLGRVRSLAISHFGICGSLIVILLAFLPVHLDRPEPRYWHEEGYNVSSDCLNITKCTTCIEQPTCAFCAHVSPSARISRGSCVATDIEGQFKRHSKEGRCSKVRKPEDDHEQPSRPSPDHDHPPPTQITNNTEEDIERILSPAIKTADLWDINRIILDAQRNRRKRKVEQYRILEYAGGKNVVYFYDNCPAMHAWIALAGFCLFVMAFAPGSGPMSWTLTPELYPLWFRGTGHSLATFCSWTSSMIVYQIEKESLRTVASFGLFCGFFVVNVVAGVFAMFFVPETAGLPLEEIERLWMSSEEMIQRHQESPGSPEYLSSASTLSQATQNPYTEGQSPVHSNSSKETQGSVGVAKSHSSYGNFVVGRTWYGETYV